MILDSSPVAITQISGIAPASSKEFLDIKATIECGFTMKCVRDVTRTYSQMHATDKYTEHTWTIWPVGPNGWVFIYALSDSGFQSSWNRVNFWFCASLEQEVPWHSGNCSVGSHWNAYMTWQEYTVNCTVEISTHNTAQSFSQFVQMAECLFTS